MQYPNGGMRRWKVILKAVRTDGVEKTIEHIEYAKNRDDAVLYSGIAFADWIHEYKEWRIGLVRVERMTKE